MKARRLTQRALKCGCELAHPTKPSSNPPRCAVSLSLPRWPGRRLPGRGGEDGRGPLQDLDIFAEPAVFAAQLRQFPPLRGGQPAVNTGRSVRLGLFDLRLI